MAAPVAATIAKAAAAVFTDKNLRKIIGGIVLGIIIIIIAPIAILLSVINTGQSIDWSSPEMQQQIMDNMTAEEQERLQRFVGIMQNIEDEITVQGLSVEPIKAQVVFLCMLSDYEETDALYVDFVSCFEDDNDDEAVFENLAEKFDIHLTAEEKEKVLLLCEKAMASSDED